MAGLYNQGKQLKLMWELSIAKVPQLCQVDNKDF